MSRLAAGTVIGIVLASKKDNKTKQNISKKTRALAHALNDKIDGKFEELLRSVSSEVKKMSVQSNQD